MLDCVFSQCDYIVLQIPRQFTQIKNLTFNISPSSTHTEQWTTDLISSTHGRVASMVEASLYVNNLFCLAGLLTSITAPNEDIPTTLQHGPANPQPPPTAPTAPPAPAPAPAAAPSTTPNQTNQTANAPRRLNNNKQ
jgi:hypothetical protein